MDLNSTTQHCHSNLHWNPLHDSISAAYCYIKRIITYTHQDPVHKIEMLGTLLCQKTLPAWSKQRKRQTVNPQHEARKERDRHALKSRTINRAEPEYSRFVWLSSSRPPSSRENCWLDFRSRKFKENGSPNTFFHVTLLVQPELHYSAFHKTSSRSPNGTWPTKASCTPYPQNQLPATARKFLRMIHVPCNVLLAAF